MGKSAISVLTKGTTIEEIKVALEQKYSNVQLESRNPNSYLIHFLAGSVQRTLYIFFGKYSIHDTGLDGVLASLGVWGDAKGIMTFLCETFGGYLKEDNSTDDPFIPINYELFAKGKEFTKMDEFRHKVIAELGHKNLEKVMKLLEEYKDL